MASIITTGTQRVDLKVKEMYIKSKEILYVFTELSDILYVYFLILPHTLKSCSHYVQNYYSLKESIPLEQVGEAGPP